MWRRTYLLLILVRLYFALSPSYIHPDENFQGPEVIAGKIFSFPHHLTWEFTSSEPIRSVFPLWPVYGLPMVILRWVWTETGKEEVAPRIVYYTLRALMFILSFVLEDWAIHELVPSPQQRTAAVVFVASSYVTWTYQTHTFSNSIETLIVLWSLVLIQRILANRQRSSVFSSSLLGILLIFGIFNRITFPAFLLIPGLYLIPHVIRKPITLLALTLSTLLAALVAIITDTSFYSRLSFSLTNLLRNPTIAPLNSLLYNSQSSNLALHGLHPPYQHFLVNLPLLLGPAYLLLLASPTRISFPPPLRLISALSGTAFLSLITHAEPRFLLPAVPLILSSIRLPRSKILLRYFLGAWIVFNAALGVLMGMYHQGGVVPMQIWLGQQGERGVLEGVGKVLWWRTYSPPMWLMDGNRGEGGVETVDLMGNSVEEVMELVKRLVGGCRTGQGNGPGLVVLVAPKSSVELDRWTGGDVEGECVFEEMWSHRLHLNLDDLEFERDGVWATLKRVIGRRGLTAWKIKGNCER